MERGPKTRISTKSFIDSPNSSKTCLLNIHQDFRTTSMSVFENNPFKILFQRKQPLLKLKNISKTLSWEMFTFSLIWTSPEYTFVSQITVTPQKICYSFKNTLLVLVHNPFPYILIIKILTLYWRARQFCFFLRQCWIKGRTRIGWCRGTFRYEFFITFP